MLESINIHSNVAVYEQIENGVKAAIASGELKGGDKLPSVRELSERLGLNFNTIAKSYRDLEVMGYIHSRRGMGVFVRPGGEEKCRKDIREKVVVRLHEVVAEAKAAGISGSDVQAVVKKCLESNAGPFEDTPKSLLAMARKI